LKEKFYVTLQIIKTPILKDLLISDVLGVKSLMEYNEKQYNPLIN